MSNSNKQVIFVCIALVIWILLYAILNNLIPEFMNLVIYAIAGWQSADWIIELSEYIFNKKEK